MTENSIKKIYDSFNKIEEKYKSLHIRVSLHIFLLEDEDEN